VKLSGNLRLRVPKGKGKGTTVLVSSTTRGKTVVSAKAKGLKRADTTVEFVEKPRFCMGCGSRMAVMDKKCGKCGYFLDKSCQGGCLNYKMQKNQIIELN